MSRPIKQLEHAWRALALVFAVALAGEAWYIHLLSDKLNAARLAQSKALERHIDDQYRISQMKREAKPCPPTGGADVPAR